MEQQWLSLGAAHKTGYPEPAPSLARTSFLLQTLSWSQCLFTVREQYLRQGIDTHNKP